MKKCPFCAEDIKDEAIKCRHCGSMLGDTSNPTVPPPKFLSATDAEVRDLLLAKRRIAAIELLRKRQALGLVEAKSYVDRLAVELGIPLERSKVSSGFVSAVIFMLVGGGAFLFWTFTMGAPPREPARALSSEIQTRAHSGAEGAFTCSSEKRDVARDVLATFTTPQADLGGAIATIGETKTGGLGVTFSGAWWRVIEGRLTETITSIADADACVEGKARLIEFFGPSGARIGFADPIEGIKVGRGLSGPRNEQPQDKAPAVGDTWDDALPKLNAMGPRQELIRVNADTFIDVRSGRRFTFSRPSRRIRTLPNRFWVSTEESASESALERYRGST